MKKVLSLSALFAMLVFGACSVSPKSVISDLEGSWTGTEASGVTKFTFADSSLTAIDSDGNSSTYTLVTDPKTLKLGKKTYVIYKLTGREEYVPFRGEQGNLYSIGAASSIQELKDAYDIIKALKPEGVVFGQR